MAYYTCWGSVRGNCGHYHKSIEAAEKCIARDDRGCAAQGGYSDRSIRVIDSPDELKRYDVTVGPGRSLIRAD
jgi:hypothetical protein